jgi:hypothetical protein
MARPISYLAERWKIYAPIALIVICLPFAMSRPTFLGVAGLLIAVIWLIVALRDRSAEVPESMRKGGLTPTMQFAMRRALAEKAKGEAHDAARHETSALDSLAKARVGGREIYLRIGKAMKNERGVHIESLLACLGALAGYACQVCVRENNARSGAKSAEAGFVVIGTKDGGRFFAGDVLNQPLAESKYSVWSLTAGAIQQLGKPLPDIDGVFKHVVSSIGRPQFGVPRMPAGHNTGDLPINYLKPIWPRILPIARQFCDAPEHLPIVFGFAIQSAILASHEVIDATLAGTIAMESAVAMSKVDLG